MSYNPAFIRHGDVLLSPIDSIPDGSSSLSHKGEHVLAWGEVTGHAHRLRVKDPKNLKVYQNGQTVYLVLMEIGALTHEEHSTVEVVPGTYKMDFEREYSYVDMDMQKVID